MSLINDVKSLCNRLAPKGWARLLKKHGLDIDPRRSVKQLRQDLQEELAVDRNVPGFEDFAFEGKCAIQPGVPSQSLLHHALASPNVLRVDGKELGAFPTLREIETVENYVYGVQPPSQPELTSLAAGDLMAVAVFASEYRPAVDTVHQKHADMCFSRTGVARVGNAPPSYDARARGFVPFAGGDDHGIRVLPARYAAYIAVQRSGREESFGPMRFNYRRKHPEAFGGPDGRDPGDQGRTFWVPLHKLFDGDECLRGESGLEVRLVAHHVNEKLRRIHLELGRRGKDTGWSGPVLDTAPFRFTDRLAGFSADRKLGSGVLVPVVHDRFVEAASRDGKPLTFIVPATDDEAVGGDFAPTLNVIADGGHAAPEYVHVRHAPGESKPNLNDRADAPDVVKAGGYRALHYLDFTADGWVEVVCPQLNAKFPRTIPAYSLVAPPDFYPNCDQRELLDWWVLRAPKALREFLWNPPPQRGPNRWFPPPWTLADERLAPNLKLTNVDFNTGDPSEPRADFVEEDDTVTAIVSMPFPGHRQERPLVPAARNRHTWLPDGSAGVFAPGWDVSFDRTGGVAHLAGYGLGSPFPEDSKLCAALSSFWAAVAPDAGRSFSEVFPTISPMTDEEIGQTGKLPWDGTPGPRLVSDGGQEVAEFATFEFVDYVENSLANKFSLSLTGKLTTEQYIARVLAMARAYRAVGVRKRDAKAEWEVLSFRAAPAGDADLKRALADVPAAALGERPWRVELCKLAGTVKTADHRRTRFHLSDRTLLFVGGNPTVLVRAGTGRFHPRTVDF
jgi:hypothetical protein